MKKRILIVVLLVLVLSSLVIGAAESSPECGFLCKVINWWNSFRGNVVGKATEEKL